MTARGPAELGRATDRTSADAEVPDWLQDMFATDRWPPLDPPGDGRAGSGSGRTNLAGGGRYGRAEAAAFAPFATVIVAQASRAPTTAPIVFIIQSLVSQARPMAGATA